MSNTLTIRRVSIKPPDSYKLFESVQHSLTMLYYRYVVKPHIITGGKG